MEKVDTLVIGAGIAGLSAAWALQQRGRTPLVLEAAPEVGGRMRSQACDGFLIDTGAQFLSSGYTRLIALAGEFGVALEPVVREHSAIVRAQRLRAMRNGHPGDALRSGLLGVSDCLRLGWLQYRHRQALRSYSLSDYSAWAEFDDEDTASWLAREANKAAVERVYEPLLEGFYFQQPETTSRALSMMVSGFAWRGEATLSPVGGMGALAVAMAARLQVRCGEAVLALRELGEHVIVQTPRALYQANEVVCALPAPQAAAVWTTAPDAERALMQTDYSSSINIGLMTGPGFVLPPDWDRVYGVLVPRGERQHIAAFGVEAHKGRDRAQAGTLINAMLDDAAARELMELDDAALLDRLRPELQQRLSGLGDARWSARVFRWPQAEPRSPVGRARAVARYRAGHRGSARVLLAGDYLSGPYTEGAVESGQWAAARLG